MQYSTRVKCKCNDVICCNRLVFLAFYDRQLYTIVIKSYLKMTTISNGISVLGNRSTSCDIEIHTDMQCTL